MFLEFLVLTSLGLISRTTNAHFLVRDNLNVPCSFTDSINITDGIRLANGSYLHEGIVYPEYLVGKYNYEFTNATLRTSVKSHLRGCICKLKTCLRSCCGSKQEFIIRNRSCVDVNDYVISDMPITDKDGDVFIADVFQKFAFVSGRPCDSVFYVEPEVNDFDYWNLFEDGSVWASVAEKRLSKDEYCLSLRKPINSTAYNMTLAVCYYDVDFNAQYTVYSYAMIFSIPFMMATIIVYILIPELRNLHGKSLICYLSGLVIAYSIVSFLLIHNGRYISDGICTAIGFTAYYFFLSSFLWLSVISFDLWWNFRGTHGVAKYKEAKRFCIYSLYAYGIPLIFLGVNITLQEMDIPDIYKSGIGGGQFCFLDVSKKVQLFYFYGPIIAVLIFNTTMFVMTSLKIHQVQREMARIMARKDSQRNLHKEKDKFGLFLRLFIVMGVTWMAEMIAWICELNHVFIEVFYLTDLCNGIQGFIIFALFVLKKKVKVLIVKRYHAIRGTSDRTSQYSSKTTSSNITMTTLTSVTPVNKEPPLNSERPLMKERNEVT